MADPFKLGNKFFSAKKYPRAIKKYTQALEREPEDEEAAAILVNRSAAYTHTQEYELAIADAQLAAQRRPRWAKTQVRLAEALSRKQAFDQADKAWALAGEYAETDEERERYEDLRKQAAAAAARAADQNDSESLVEYTRMSESWYAKSAQLRLDGPPRTSADAVFAVGCYAWEKCEEAWAGINRAVYRAPGGIRTHLFGQDLVYLVEPILTFKQSFHIPRYPQEDLPLFQKLQYLLQSEAQTGRFEHYFDGTWTAARIIDDLDDRIHEDFFNGRRLVRRITTAIIYGRILQAHLHDISGRHGNAAETYRMVVDLHEAGRAKWAHESLDTKGNVFSPTMNRSVKMEYMRCLLAGHRAAKTASAKRAFALEKIETWANEVLQIPFHSLYWYYLDRHDPRFRLAFDNLPRWEAHAGLGYVNYVRVCDSLRDFPEGEVVFADHDAATECAKQYQAAADLMADDFVDKRIMLYDALYGYLRAGGLTVREVRERVAEAEHVDAIVTPYFGPIAEGFEQRTFSRNLCDGIADLPAHVVLRPVPTLRCPIGQDAQQYITAEIWEGTTGDADIVDILGSLPRQSRSGGELAASMTRLSMQ
ncbi:hypothetical protein JCM10908_003016 [Rhodotorula pacifica]|uniref:uncharacterized protein n=1 Tax=Rhodotorula pacifica TaxID=1495444 RepID=UPI00316C81B9